ncbi:GGDEF domain-containing protein [Mycolicibacterium arenosum]|uniref:GGDEF domain-containing protein n=1 Tax=Mycolicibacterium arenosum TaxID=2952157 RepID=A0ABT1M6V0_9MYCO|nr:GGDEF domain-containing protein [Mycolicibacterium sp. CAU 1645]MCP9274142.1 GGDEF domain-containing protein [Mycolicibacterium sp. CAU 1645]
MLILVWVAVVVIFHEYLLDVPSALLSWVPLLLIGVGLPAVLRWLSGSHSPWNRWSQALFVLATYLDVACLMVIRVAGLQQGAPTLPIVVPVAILMSLVIAQIRFAYLASAILLGLVGIIVAELSVHQVTTGSLFDMAASAGIVAVSLASAYELEASSRAAWMRARALDELTRIDSLTGLPNRRFLDQRLYEIISAGGSVTLAIFDIDDFKAFNDHFGHPAGDECLRSIGEHLRRQLDDEHESAARYAGEEFAVVWRNTAPETALARAEHLRASIGEIGITRPDGNGPLTASAGTAELYLPPNDTAALTATDASDLLYTMMNRADRALYRAKAAGRDRSVHDLSTISYADREKPPSLIVAPTSRDDFGPRLHATATTLRFAAPEDEAEFRDSDEELGRRTRRFIMIGLLAVCAFIFFFQGPLLKIPPEAATFGRLTLVIGLMPAAIVAAVGASARRLRRWSAPIYVGAVGVILTAQMVERAILMSRGFDVVPFLMPISVLLSLCVVQIAYNILMPSMVVMLTGIIVFEALTIPLSGYQALAMSTAVVMAFVTVRFAYQLERSRRLDWSRSKLLEIQSLTDPLTRLPNRRAVLAHLREMLAESREPALLLVDVDHFKAYNDRFGHLAGDGCLVAVGEQLRVAAAACGGMAARLGGEEFAVVMPGGPTAAEEAARIRSLATGPQTADGQGGPVTVSAGLAPATGTASDDPDSVISELLSRADRALYAAKRNGRDCLVVDVGDRTDGCPASEPHPR